MYKNIKKLMVKNNIYSLLFKRWIVKIKTLIIIYEENDFESYFWNCKGAQTVHL